MHRMQTMCMYNAPKPEQKTVQVKDSLTKPSYQQKPLLQLPKREGNSMNVTCYQCGQAGHIWTNCPCLMKVRTAAIREDGTEEEEETDNNAVSYRTNGSDLEEFKVFITGILRWLKMNCLLGETSIEMQVDYLGTHLTGKVQEWLYRNVE